MEKILGENSEEQAVEEEQDPEISAEPETEEQIIIEPEKVNNPPMPVNTSSGSYHAIAGAFSSRENADRMMSKLKEKGYPAFVSQRGALYFVSMKQFATKEEANAAVLQLKTDATQVWIFEGDLR